MSFRPLQDLVFKGTVFHEVEEGTRITDRRTGQFEVVRKGNIVMADNHCYMVAEDYKTLLEHPEVKNARKI